MASFSFRMPLTVGHLQLAVLVLAVPTQYFIVRLMGSSEVTRTHAISEMVREVKDLSSRWFRVESWRRWCLSLFTAFTPTDDTGGDDNLGESPAVEVLKHRQKHTDGHFTRSMVPRNPRAPHVRFRIGQVIRHKLWGYSGVIIGWDETAIAPESWIRQMHGKHTRWRHQPNYSILVDTRDRMQPQTTYVPEENLEVLRQFQVIHPQIDDYFEKYDGSQYLPRPWLKALYPKD